MRPARALAFTVIALTLAWAGSALGTSSTISYQGKLTTSGGAPVADGDYAVVFSLWTDSVGGSLIWTELQDVHVTGGEGDQHRHISCCLQSQLLRLRIGNSDSHRLDDRLNRRQVGSAGAENGRQTR